MDFHIQSYLLLGIVTLACIFVPCNSANTSQSPTRYLSRVFTEPHRPMNVSVGDRVPISWIANFTIANLFLIRVDGGANHSSIVKYNVTDNSTWWQVTLPPWGVSAPVAFRILNAQSKIAAQSEDGFDSSPFNIIKRPETRPSLFNPTYQNSSNNGSTSTSHATSYTSHSPTSVSKPLYTTPLDTHTHTPSVYTSTMQSAVSSASTYTSQTALISPTLMPPPTSSTDNSHSHSSHTPITKMIAFGLGVGLGIPISVAVIALAYAFWRVRHPKKALSRSNRHTMYNGRGMIQL